MATITAKGFAIGDGGARPEVGLVADGDRGGRVHRLRGHLLDPQLH